MPVRIYALSKELKIDSKELVDICKRAGVTGKGSALASLTDDEANKVMAYLSGKTKPSGKVATQPVGSSLSDAAVRALRREDYIPPAGVSGPITIEVKTKRPASERTKKDGEGEVPKPPTKKEPHVKLAAIPKSTAPPAATPTLEPTPQKPILTLPADAIRGAKSGSKAPLEQFTRQQDKRRQATAPPPKGPAKGAQPVVREPARRDRRRAKGDDEKEEQPFDSDKRLAGMANARAARQQNRKRRTVHQVTLQADDDMPLSAPSSRRGARLVRKATSTAAPRRGKQVVDVPCSLRTFSESPGIPTSQIQRSLMGLGTMVSINAQINMETAELLAADMGVDVELRVRASLEDAVLAELGRPDEDPSLLSPRAPVVTFLGHVDHGKTSLLDRIIGIDVVSGEAGGITQHIRAYEVNRNGRKIAFVDTPGHEAFTEMRARGAQVTDIAVLVVAADDGVMPQTEEAINHARAAGVPIVVALNKIDLRGADVNRVLQGLSTHGLLPTEWGGDVEVIKTSALTGDGIDDLLETLLLTADLHEYKANPNRPAFGTCLEAQQEGNQGVVAKMMIRNGTLRLSDVLVCGGAHGRVKAMYDTLRPNKRLKEASPSTPVHLTGLDQAPQAGEAFYVLEDISQAREIANRRTVRSREQILSAQTTRISFEEFQRRVQEGILGRGEEVTTLNLIVRADVRGSIEAIENELEKLKHPEVQVKILQKMVGGITRADVTLADASEAVIIGFNVIPDEAARALAEERGVEIRRYDVIYRLTEDIKALLEGKLKPEERVADLGRALVQQIFNISRIGTIAGCRVLAGTIQRGCRVRVSREGRGIGDYELESLRREKDDTKEVREGLECGMKLAGFNDLKEGDILEAYKIEEVARSL